MLLSGMHMQHHLLPQEEYYTTHSTGTSVMTQWSRDEEYFVEISEEHTHDRIVCIAYNTR